MRFWVGWNAYSPDRRHRRTHRTQVAETCVWNSTRYLIIVYLSPSGNQTPDPHEPSQIGGAATCAFPFRAQGQTNAHYRRAGTLLIVMAGRILESVRHFPRGGYTLRRGCIISLHSKVVGLPTCTEFALHTMLCSEYDDFITLKSGDKAGSRSCRACVCNDLLWRR